MKIHDWPGRSRRATLTLSQVDDVILHCLEPSQDVEYAEKHGMSEGCIRAIRTGRTWGWRRRELAAEGRL